MKSMDFGHVARQVLARVRKQFLCERVVRDLASGDLHHGLHGFAEVFVWYPEHRDVGDLGVHHECVLDLLWIDVHAARDDHECLAIGEVQVPSSST